MERVSRTAITILIVLAAVIGYVVITERMRPSDEEEIRAVLEKVRTAVERRNYNGVMSCVSKNYSDAAGSTYETLNLKAQEALRAIERVEVSVEQPRVTVSGESAELRAAASITIEEAGLRRRLIVNQFTLHLAKEDATRFLVLHTKRWKITRLDVGSFRVLHL